ncbi:MAG: hypothetical protein MK085_03275 [Phycisphaerales bacterium]|nr:hypothetical protein [Phycisphaerales bacterium]
MLEILIALAVFTAAAGYTLLAIRDGAEATDRAARRVVAIDLAASRLAEIEAGIVAIEDGADFGMDDFDRSDELEVEIISSPSAFDGLTMVEVLVYDTSLDALDDTEPLPLAHLSALLPRENLE